MEQNLCSPSAMNRDRNPATERIMSLILEIVWLLTGEDCVVVKKQDGHTVPSCSSSADVSEGFLMVQGSETDPTPRSETPESSSSRKSLQPLPCEVPVREEDVAIHVTIEEREYGERHKKQHKGEFTDISERCHLPAYTQEGLEENRLIPPNYQMEPRDRMLPHRYKNEESIRNQMSVEPFPTQTAADRCPIPPYSQHCAHESGGILEIHQGYKEEEDETPTEMSSDEAIGRNAARTAHSPPYSQDFIHEENTSTQDFQMEQLNVIVLQQCKEEEIPAEISTGNSLEGVGQPEESPHALLYHSHSEQEAPFAQSSRGGKVCEKRSFRRRQKRNKAARQTGLTIREITLPQGDYAKEAEESETGEKPFTCSDCGKYFSSKSNLFRHLKIHLGFKPFKCLECGKSFSQKEHLLIHKRTHTGEKPYSCSQCMKQFKHKSNLDAHQRVHTGAKPYPCPVCGKWFSVKRVLAEHQVVHTGEKPYTCEKCGKPFPYRSSLAVHYKNQHL